MTITPTEKLAGIIAKTTAPKENSRRLRNINEIMQILKKNGFFVTDAVIDFASKELFGVAESSRKKEIEVMKNFLNEAKYQPNA